MVDGKGGLCLRYRGVEGGGGGERASMSPDSGGTRIGEAGGAIVSQNQENVAVDDALMWPGSGSEEGTGGCWRRLNQCCRAASPCRLPKVGGQEEQRAKSASGKAAARGAAGAARTMVRCSEKVVGRRDYTPAMHGSQACIHAH